MRKFGYSDLQGLHRILLQSAWFCCTDHSYSRDMTVFSIDCDANKDHVEGDRYDGHELIVPSSAFFQITDINDRITMSTMRMPPLFEHA